MRVCVIIAHNGRAPIATAAALKPITDRLIQIYRDEAQINVSLHIEEGGKGPNVHPDCGTGAWTIRIFG